MFPPSSHVSLSLLYPKARKASSHEASVISDRQMWEVLHLLWKKMKKKNLVFLAWPPLSVLSDVFWRRDWGRFFHAARPIGCNAEEVWVEVCVCEWGFTVIPISWFGVLTPTLELRNPRFQTSVINTSTLTSLENKNRNMTCFSGSFVTSGELKTSSGRQASVCGLST